VLQVAALAICLVLLCARRRREWFSNSNRFNHDFLSMTMLGYLDRVPWKSKTQNLKIALINNNEGSGGR
jgi:hypothetical protein